MSDFNPTCLNGKEIDAEIYTFARHGADVGMMTAGITTSGGNQIGARFDNLITHFREETGRELHEVAKRFLHDGEDAGFIINHKQGKIRYSLKSPDPERDKQTNLFEFDRTSPRESLQAVSF